MHTGRGLLGHAPDRGETRRVPDRVGRELRLDRRVELGLFLARRLGDQRRILLDARAEMQQQRRVTPIVEDHVRVAAISPFEDPVRVVPVVGERLALDGEDRRALTLEAVQRDRGGRMVLRREDVARRPAHFGTQRLQGLDQHRGLDRHVQRSGDACAGKGLSLREFLADRHQTGHLGLGDQDFLAAPRGQRKVGDLEVGKVGNGGGFQYGAHHELLSFEEVVSAVAIANQSRDASSLARPTLESAGSVATLLDAGSPILPQPSRRVLAGRSGKCGFRARRTESRPR